ncbi:restriction endonuclease [Empedobacter brevis]|uniref:restriction endonuclease n=1 Tax=Empedobacter brevis TaxID=247 RepID=UPI00132FD7E6|nr:restriction endonuclease [Empedobacter brevis]
MQKISTQAVIALKDALTNIYWRKKDLRQFIELTIENSSIVATIDWQEPLKQESVSILIDRMVARQDLFQNDLLRLIQEVGNFSDFSHLSYFDKDGSLTKRAKETVTKLRNQTKGYFDAIEELKKTEERRNANLEKVKTTMFFSQKLEELKTKFFEIAINTNKQQRGFQLEKLLNELFILFELSAKSSFKITGEQIDGAFTFDGTDFLLEAKWQKEPIPASELYAFGGKITNKLKNTLGLFISIDGFSKDGIETNNPITKQMILMDGEDLMLIFDGRIQLNEMILLKRQHASQTGEIFYKLR